MPVIKFENTECYTCHLPVPGYTVEETQSGSLLTASQEELTKLATEMLETQKPVASYDLNEILKLYSLTLLPMNTKAVNSHTVRL